MTLQEVTRLIDREWDFDIGFLGKLREGEFDRTSLPRVTKLLNEAIALTANRRTLSKRLVAVTWFIPLHMNWQRERIEENGYDLIIYDNATEELTELVQRLLGFP